MAITGAKPVQIKINVLVFSMQDFQQSLNNHFDWGVVENAMQHNTRDRFNWKLYLGMSLTRAVAKLRYEGLTAEQTYYELLKTHPELNEELRRRLKIGVCARFGEMGTVEKVLK